MTDFCGLAFHQAKHYRQGRLKDVRVVVLHSAEGAKTATELGDYFAHTDRDASAHIGVGQSGDAQQYVHDTDTAFGAASVNSDGWHVELCGFAHWTRQDWLSHSTMLDRAASLVAKALTHYRLPATYLTADALAGGGKGIVTHATVSKAYPSTGHTDPGTGFPLDVFLTMIRHHLPAPDWHKDGFTHPLLKLDYTGSEVRHLQNKLNEKGAHLAPDAVYGEQTRAAVWSFQQTHHLTADGICGDKTWAALHAA